MIVRILGEGQYEVPESARPDLDKLDAVVEDALEASDEEAFHKALESLIGAVRKAGSPVDPARIVPSDLAVPTTGLSLDEVRELLASEASADTQ